MLNITFTQRTYLGGMLLTALVLIAAPQALAQDARDCTSRSCWMAAIDGNFASAIDSDVISSGAGFGLRFGLQRDLRSALLIPELALEHHVLAADTPNNAAVTTIMIGGRMRFLKLVQPGLFVHVGAGRIAGDSGFATTDLAFDVGATVDMTVLPLLDLGLHAALNRVFGGRDGALMFATIGIHAALVIEDTL